MPSRPINRIASLAWALALVMGAACSLQVREDEGPLLPVVDAGSADARDTSDASGPDPRAEAGESGGGADRDGETDSLPTDGVGAPDATTAVPCAPLAPYPDPTARGPYEVGTSTYSAPSIVLGSPGMVVGVRAALSYPAIHGGEGAPVAPVGAFPVAILIHGNHAIYRQANGLTVPCDETFVAEPPHLKTLEEVQQSYPGAERIASHLGYGYLADNLASRGYVVASIDASDANCINVDGGFVAERARLVAEHARLLVSDEPPAAELKGRLDSGRIVYIGHSRGGEAVLEAGRGGSALGASLRGVLAVAPSNFLFDSKARSFDSPVLVVLPAADGDVSLNGGMRYYDVAAPAAGAGASWFKTQQYVHGANHNFFNAEWNEPRTRCGTTAEDGDNGEGTGRLTRGQQERYLVALVRTFLDAALGGSATARSALSGSALIEGQEGVIARASMAEKPTAIPLLNAPARTGFSFFGKYPFTNTVDAYNDSFFHATTGYVGVWEGVDAALGPASLFLPVPEPVAILVMLRSVWRRWSMPTTSRDVASFSMWSWRTHPVTACTPPPIGPGARSPRGIRGHSGKIRRITARKSRSRRRCWKPFRSRRPASWAARASRGNR